MNPASGAALTILPVLVGGAVVFGTSTALRYSA